MARREAAPGALPARASREERNITMSRTNENSEVESVPDNSHDDWSHAFLEIRECGLEGNSCLWSRSQWMAQAQCDSKSLSWHGWPSGRGGHRFRAASERLFKLSVMSKNFDT